MLVIIILLAVFLVWVVTVYNRLVKEKLKVQTQWSQIDVVLKQRFDMIPNLVETVKGYTEHEKDTLQAVINARNGYLSANGPAAQIKSNTELTGAMSRLMAVAESYPELKASRNFLNLQQQIGEIEDKLADYRQFYNDTVMRYNSLLVTVPTNIIAKLFNFSEEAFFRAEDEEKVSLTIEF